MMDTIKLTKWLERIRRGYRKKDDTIEETRLRLQFFSAQALLEILENLDRLKERPTK